MHARPLFIFLTLTLTTQKCPNDEYCVSCDGTTCESCIYSYLDTDGICKLTTAVPNCLSYMSPDNCSECDIGYYLLDNTCHEIEVENCAFVDPEEPNICIACYNSIVVTEGACDSYAMCDDEYCEICPAASICSYCKEGYSLTPEFNCVPDPVDGCFSTNLDYDYCASCKNGFYHNGRICKETEKQSGELGFGVGFMFVVFVLMYG